MKTILLAALWLSIIQTAFSQSTDFMPMIYVEGGVFGMGSTDNEAFEDAKFIHRVELSSFWISKYEVTVAQYRAYCKETGVAMPKNPNGSWRDNDPISNVSWYEAKDFAEWLSEKTGRRYNLPTEAQWEYAAKGGKKTQDKIYAGSDTLELVANSNCDEMVVGQKRPNELGIYDMTGNVKEWCRDWYHALYYRYSEATNPI